MKEGEAALSTGREKETGDELIVETRPASREVKLDEQEPRWIKPRTPGLGKKKQTH